MLGADKHAMMAPAAPAHLVECLQHKPTLGGQDVVRVTREARSTTQTID